MSEGSTPVREMWRRERRGLRDDAAAGQRRSGLEDPPAADWTGDVWWCGVHSYYVSHAETTTLTTLLDHTGPQPTVDMSGPNNLSKFVLEAGPEECSVKCRITRNCKGLDKGRTERTPGREILQTSYSLSRDELCVGFYWKPNNLKTEPAINKLKIVRKISTSSFVARKKGREEGRNFFIRVSISSPFSDCKCKNSFNFLITFVGSYNQVKMQSPKLR